MFKNNNKIDNFQLFAIGAMMGNALFVGMGNIILVKTAQQNTWIVALVSIIIGFIPICLLCKIMNYAPNLNLIEKIKKAFGTKIGFILNLILVILIFIILIIDLWGVSIFANTKYLTETPLIFIVFLFLIPIVYATNKGIETISRTILILFYIGIICHVFITGSLLEYVKIDNIKPIMVDGLKPIIIGIGRFLCYCISPLITILIIPRHNIKQEKNSKKALIIGYIYAAVIMLIVFFMDTSTVGIEIDSMYRYPEYFIMKKVSIVHIFKNVENIFSVVWIYNMCATGMMCLYYIKEYLINIFKIKKEKQKKITTIVMAIIVLFLSSNIFSNATDANNFMMYKFPVFIGLPIFIIIFLISIVVIFKKKNEKKIS